MPYTPHTHIHTHQPSAVFPKINLGVRLFESQWVWFTIQITHRVSSSMCLLPLSVLWVSKTTRDSYKAFFSFFFLKLLQFQLAVLVDLTYWTCFDTILTLELLLSTFVTMGTRLERTQVTLCGSNTELIHRVLPSWEFHMAPTSSHQGHDIFFFSQPCCCSTTTHLCQHMYTYTCICTQPHSQNTSDIFKFYCRMFTGERSSFSS